MRIRNMLRRCSALMASLLATINLGTSDAAKRNTKERKRADWGVVALVAGIVLSAGNIHAQATGYIQGDPAEGKLVPYYEATGNLATIIGIENVSSSGSGVVANANYIFVHIVIFNTGSKEQFDLTLCLSPYDFGFVILQEDPASGLQLVGLGPKRVSKKPSDGPSGGP